MNIQVVLRPEYEYLRPFIVALPDRFCREGEVIYKGRNEIRVMESHGMTLNVKQFGVPIFFNRVAYSFFRSPKAQRAYEYALVLGEKQIPTPEPIAYIILKKNGLQEKSYFISRQVDYSRRFYEFGTNALEGNEDIVRALARFTTNMHEAEVYHRDYSPGNILFDRVDGGVAFCVVDINRMRFGKVSVEKGCANFARLWGQQPFFRLLAGEYARCRHADPDRCVKWVFHYREKFWKRYRKRHTVMFDLDL